MFDEALSNSLVDTKMNIVGIERVSFMESGSFGYDLERISANAEIGRLRDQRKADTVCLIRSPGDYWGIAWDLPSLDPWYEAHAFCIVDYNHVANYYVMGHEFGHLLGGRS